MRYLTEEEIYKLLDSQGLTYVMNTSTKSDVYKNYITYLCERGLDCEDFILKNGSVKYNYKQMAIELSKVLANKINLGSEEFWSLFSYKESNYSSDWKSKNNKNEWESNIYGENQKKYLISMYKGENLEKFVYFLDNYPYPKNELIKLWFDMTKSNKEINLTVEPYSFIEKYGKPEKESHLLMRARMYALFDHPIAIKKITELYKMYENKEAGLSFEKILKEKDPSFIPYEPVLFEEYKSVVYKNVINIERLALSKKYDVIPAIESNLFNILEYTLNWKSKELNFKTNINTNEYYHDVIKSIDKNIASFEIISYSEEQLNTASKWFKDLINSLDIICENKGKNLLNRKNKKLTDDIEQMDSLAKLLDATISYNNMNNIVPNKCNAFKKKKI